MKITSLSYTVNNNYNVKNKKIIENTTVVIPQPDSPLVQMVKQSKVTKE